MDMEPIEIGGILYHARDGQLLRDEDDQPVPADICICWAHNEYECVCGAWDMPIQKADRAEGRNEPDMPKLLRHREKMNYVRGIDEKCRSCGGTGIVFSLVVQVDDRDARITTLTADLDRLTAELAEVREQRNRIVATMTAELERKQRECEGLRSALDDLIGAVKHLNPCPATMEKATAALSAGEQDGHA